MTHNRGLDPAAEVLKIRYVAFSFRVPARPPHFLRPRECRRVKPLIAVIGDSVSSPSVLRMAGEVGRLIAREGAILVCGGLGGVMEAAARGAKEGGGLTLGILPGYDPAAANPHIDLAICTGMGHARNAIIAATATALIALEGAYGTLSEMALGLKLGRRVVALGRRENPRGVLAADTPEEAVRLALHG